MEDATKIDNVMVSTDGFESCPDHMEREIKFLEVFEQMCQTFDEIHYMNGDISDVGNEIGYALGKVLPNLTEDEIKDFIHGVKHGISLTNGTH